MSFSFSFSGDDIEDDKDLESNTDPHPIDHVPASTLTSTPDVLATQLQNTTLTTKLLPPQRHTLADLLASLPSQVSYNFIDVPLSKYETATGNGRDTQSPSKNARIRIPRRSLFDIRQQLMAESDPSNNDDETGSLLAGLETGDLRSGIYEGGFKTWECAVDLAGLVANESTRNDESEAEGTWHVMELGAGSAVPSLVLLQNLLTRRAILRGEKPRKVRFTLCDYNEDVLRLGTAVNVFLTALLSLEDQRPENEEDEEGETEIDAESIQKVLKGLEDANIEIDFVSGAWGKEFVQCIGLREDEKTLGVLVLASETIYSPGSLDIFSQTVLDVLQATGGEKKAYVAAKKVYFGVGGGVQEFEESIRRLGGTSQVVLDVKSAGVGRVVLEVSKI